MQQVSNRHFDVRHRIVGWAATVLLGDKKVRHLFFLGRFSAIGRIFFFFLK